MTLHYPSDVLNPTSPSVTCHTAFAKNTIPYHAPHSHRSGSSAWTRPQPTHYWLTKFPVPHPKLKGHSYMVFAGPLFPFQWGSPLLSLSSPSTAFHSQPSSLNFNHLYTYLSSINPWSWEQRVYHVHLYILSIWHSVWLMTFTGWPIFWFINNGSIASQAWMWLVLGNNYPQPNLCACGTLWTYHWITDCG